jgi:ParB family chromosome partitioning protein
MAKKATNKALGKGLDAIFGDGLTETIETINKVQEKGASKDQIVKIPLSKILVNPYQPRRQFDEEKLEDLSKSIQENGLLTPIVVKETEGDKYYIIAGERRYRAHKLLKKQKINAVVIKVSDKKMAELAIMENIQREDLNPIEEAVAVNNLMKTHKLTQAAAAKALGKSRSYVSNLTSVLKLDEKIIEGVLEGKISYGHAKPLVALDNKVAVEFFNKMVEEK